jgi:hypothetical protein
MTQADSVLSTPPLNSSSRPAKSVVPFPRKVKARPAMRKSAIEGVRSSGYAGQLDSEPVLTQVAS